MNLKIFTVYDSKLEAYLQPFVMQSKGQALRAWIDTIQDQSTQFNKHPADFTMFEIGEWNQITGEIIKHPVKLSLGTALEMSTNQSMPI